MFLVKSTGQVAGHRMPCGRSETGAVIREVRTTAANGYAYNLGAIPQGTYQFVIGVDSNDNGILCEGSEPCGMYPNVNQPSTLDLLNLSGMTLDHYRVGMSPLATGLLNVALTPRAAARLWKAPDAELSTWVLEQLAQTPVGRLDPRECVVHRIASRLPLFEAGYLPRLARFGSRMDASPRLAFAGDYRVTPSLEGAVVSGMRASLEIAAAL